MIIFAEMDLLTAVVSIATAVIALVGTAFTGVVAYLMARLNQKGTAAAVQVEEVKLTLADRMSMFATLDRKVQDGNDVIEATHKIVNSQRDAMIKEIRELKEVVARQEKKP